MRTPTPQIKSSSLSSTNTVPATRNHEPMQKETGHGSVDLLPTPAFTSTTPAPTPTYGSPGVPSYVRWASSPGSMPRGQNTQLTSARAAQTFPYDPTTQPHATPKTSSPPPGERSGDDLAASPAPTPALGHTENTSPGLTLLQKLANASGMESPTDSPTLAQRGSSPTSAQPLGYGGTDVSPSFCGSVALDDTIKQVTSESATVTQHNEKLILRPSGSLNLNELKSQVETIGNDTLKEALLILAEQREEIACGAKQIAKEIDSLADQVTVLQNAL